MSFLGSYFAYNRILSKDFDLILVSIDSNLNEVNPTGTANIYDFSYYLTSAWMDGNLINAVKKRDTKVKN